MQNGKHILRDVVLTSTDDLHFAHERAGEARLYALSQRRIPGKKSFFRAKTAKKLALPWPFPPCADGAGCTG